MKYLIILLLLTFPIFSQGLPAYQNLFEAGSDTIFQTGTSDTIQFRFWIDGKTTNWFACDSTVTTAEKVAEDNEFIPLSNQTNWFWGQYVQLLIYNDTDSITSKLFYVGNKQGAVSVILVPDSLNADTLLYTNSKIGGN